MTRPYRRTALVNVLTAHQLLMAVADGSPAVMAAAITPQQVADGELAGRVLVEVDTYTQQVGHPPRTPEDWARITAAQAKRERRARRGW